MKAGMRFPHAILSRLEDGCVVEVPLHDVVRHQRAVIVGMVGTFTPVCTHEHAPKFVTGAPYLRSLGFDLVVCVAPNDPWSVKMWADMMDPEGHVMFLADGNLDLARSLKVTFDGRAMHLGERSRRYLALVGDGIIERLSVEASPTDLTCTAYGHIAEPTLM